MTGVIILAGGKSSRMGQNKALLPVGNQTGIERILTELAPLYSNPILVSNEPQLFQSLPVQCVADNYPGMGPLAGLEAGLNASEHEWNLLVACDMPFVSYALATQLLERTHGSEIAVPVFNERIHPLFAWYHQSVLSIAQKNLKQKTLKMTALLDQCRTVYVDETQLKGIHNLEDALFNMNNQQEYKKAVDKMKE